MNKCREEFNKWAGSHTYLPIVERDFYAVWCAAWNSCHNAIDAELEPVASASLREKINDSIGGNLFTKILL